MVFLTLINVSCSNKSEQKQVHHPTLQKTIKSNYDLLQGEWKSVDYENEIVRFQGDQFFDKIMESQEKFILCDTCIFSYNKLPEKERHIAFIESETCWYIDTLNADKLVVRWLAAKGEGYTTFIRTSHNKNSDVKVSAGTNKALMSPDDLKLALVGSGHKKAELILGIQDDSAVSASAFLDAGIYYHKCLDAGGVLKNVVLIRSWGEMFDWNTVMIQEVLIVPDDGEFKVGFSRYKIRNGRIVR